MLGGENGVGIRGEEEDDSGGDRGQTKQQQQLRELAVWPIRCLGVGTTLALGKGETEGTLPGGCCIITPLISSIES